ncbi:MAG TPA: GAF domain-containing protein [Stellaceae bacterium]|nr:GAF domain-containing protein [Stellaceae bacterium]
MDTTPGSTLADAQSVIADLQRRLAEAEAREGATAEVLQVINASAGDLVPVFDAMLHRAMQLCAANFGILWTYDGQHLRPVARRGVPAEYAEFLTSETHSAADDPLTQRFLAGEPFIYAEGVNEYYEAGNRYARALVELGGGLSLLSVPLRKDGTLFGFFIVYWGEVREVDDRQVALLQNFAAQAVIAMENARLLNETQQRTAELTESLEYQTATSDVLKAISRSAIDLDAVLDTVISAAVQLCRAEYGVIFRNDGSGEYRFAAGYGNSPEYEESERQAVIRPGRGTIVGRAALEGRAVQIADAQSDPDYEDKEGVRLDNAHSMLGVPLLREGQVVGAFGLARNRVEPFSAREVELVTIFADQAVIAIENARLLSETREALEQQTATAEVLQVINSSPGDLAPVFEAMLDKAARLCDFTLGILWTYDSGIFKPVSWRGAPTAYADFLASATGFGPFPATSGLGRMVAGEDVAQIDDVAASQAYGPSNIAGHALVHLAGARTVLCVALRKDQELLGVITGYRREVRPFSDKQITLLQNFAAQAVIAIENARLLDEIRQRQAELRVTFDNMADGVVMFDEQLRLAAWNRNFQEILDLPDELLAERKAYSEYLHILAERGEFGPGDVEEELSRRLAHASEELRYERTRPNGQVLEVRRNAVAGGGFVLIYSDITERKRSEEEIRAARDAAEKALGELKTAQASLIQAEKMASLGQLTAGIAHEIKNPLNFVNNFAALSVELLEELKEVAEPALAALGDDRRDELDETIGTLSGNLEKIAEHGKRADNIVKSMLEHSRGVSGERREVDLNALVEEALNLAYHGARAHDQSFNITLERDLDRDLRPIELVPQDITRVLLNLFGNGFYAANKRAKADGGGRPMLHVATQDLGGAVEIRVRDNGTGISAEIRDKLFQPFFTTKPTGEGTGLGLSISYDIVVQQHGGTITVDSEENSFTQFTIRLPRQRAGTGGAAA